MTQETFALIGMAVFWSLTALIIAFVASVIATAIIIHFPRLHVGAPKSPCEWRAYSDAETGAGRVVQRLRLRWWIGISSRSSANWFIGVMRWERQEP